MTAGERTPLVNTTSSPARTATRVFIAKVVGAFLLTSALLAIFLASRSSDEAVAAPSDWFCGEPNVETDYIKLANKKDDYYFYWFVRSRSANADTDPLVIWLNGGPGASSLEGLLVENGPCLVSPDLTTKRNEFAWNNNANVIWLEQPSGVGFSYFTDDADKDATGEDVGANMIAFLDGFITKHPEFAGRPFYLTGESYAGHYIPAAAYAIWQFNKANASSNPPRINLQGLAIGNGDPNLALQYKYAADMAVDNAYNLTLLNSTQIDQMRRDADECAVKLNTCVQNGEGPTSCVAASDFCDSTQLGPFFAALRNVYDIRQVCTSPESCSDTDGGAVERFLSSDIVNTALARTLNGRKWNAQVRYVYSAYTTSGDWARSYMRELQEMLNDGLRMLIFAGDADLVCNWIGNRAWTLSLDWKGKDGYNAAVDRAFLVDENRVEAGVARSFDNLTFLRVFNAGHLVPKDQPRVAYEMIQRFFTHQPI